MSRMIPRRASLERNRIFEQSLSRSHAYDLSLLGLALIMGTKARKRGGGGPLGGLAVALG